MCANCFCSDTERATRTHDAQLRVQRISGSTADSVHVPLRLFGHGERDAHTQLEPGRAPVDTDVALAANKLGLRALDHSALRLDLHELFLLGHGESDTQTQLEPDRVPRRHQCRSGRRQTWSARTHHSRFRDT